MRRIPVVLAGAALAATVLIGAAGCGSAGFNPVAPVPGATAVASPAPSMITMPDVVGQNADVALDKLKKLGFTNVDLGTVDGHEVVILPQNWVVRTQTAPPGSRMGADDKIVLGCARIG